MSASVSSSSSWLRWILLNVVPMAAFGTSNLMSLAAVRDVQAALRTSKLGHLNPTPWAVLMASRIGWVSYNLAYGDVYQLASNLCSLFVALWLNLSAIKIQYSQQQWQDRTHQQAQLWQDLEPTLREASTLGMTKGFESSVTGFTKSTMEQLENESDDSSNDDDNDELILIEQPQVGGRGTDENRPWPVDPELGGALTCSNRDLCDSSTSSNDDDIERLSCSAVLADDIDCDDEQQQQQHLLLLEQVGQIVRDLVVQDDPSAVPHEYLVLGAVTVWSLLLSALLLTSTHDQLLLGLGLCVNANAALYYASPLSTIRKVWTTQSAVTIHVPTLACSLANSILWSIYGLAIHDPFVLAPNACGVVFGLVQLGLKIVFVSSSNDDDEQEADEQTIVFVEEEEEEQV